MNHLTVRLLRDSSGMLSITAQMIAREFNRRHQWRYLSPGSAQVNASHESTSAKDENLMLNDESILRSTRRVFQMVSDPDVFVKYLNLC